MSKLAESTIQHTHVRCECKIVSLVSYRYYLPKFPLHTTLSIPTQLALVALRILQLIAIASTVVEISQHKVCITSAMHYMHETYFALAINKTWLFSFLPHLYHIFQAGQHHLTMSRKEDAYMKRKKRSFCRVWCEMWFILARSSELWSKRIT